MTARPKFCENRAGLFILELSVMVEKGVKVDPKFLEDSHSMWQSFTYLIKWSSIALAILLILMAIFLV